MTKSDLLPVLDFDLEAFRALVHSLNSKAQVITLSAKTGEGMEQREFALLRHTLPKGRPILDIGA